jgi:tetratricopeptide (TPR) repeat protein
VIALIAALVLQAPQPQVTASADRGSVSRGDTVVVTITVTAQGNEPVRIAGPDLVGLALVESRETSRVQMVEGIAQRVTIRVLRLVAMTDGRAVVRGIRVTQGSRVAEAAALTVDVAPVAVGMPSLDPSLRKLLDGLAPPASPDQVVVNLVTSRTAVVLGDQVDLITVAWFPRDIRSRLRTVPTFQGPDVQGAWSYQQAGPAGVAASRKVGDRWYDLFIQYQTVFPLQTGPLRVGRVSVAYALPLTYSFLSRELRHVVPSDSVQVEVSPYPATGQPAGFGGAAGGGLTLRMDPTEYDMSVGDGRTLTVSLEGRGNVALWPEPEVNWPVGLRAYPGDVQVSVTRANGLIRGTKVFNYLLVADSAGWYQVKSPVYPYYDLDQRRYVQLAALPLEIAARPGQGPALRRAEPPPLMPATGSRMPFASRFPGAVWLAIAAAPLLLLALRRVRRPAPRARPAPATERGELDSLDRRFRWELERLVPRVRLRDGDGLADALRAAGIEAPLASHVARVRDRLRQALYGKDGSADPQELRAEVQEVLHALLGEQAGASRSGLFTRVVVALLLATPAAARAQNASPERLYDAGALRAAADSFAARAAREPDIAAHWYNLGNAWYRQGSDARAEAAWLRAARLEPRNGLVERAMALVPPPDPFSERLLWVGPVTPDEALSFAAAFWLLGSLLLPWRRWRPIAVGAVLAALAAAGYGVWTLRRYHAPVAVTLATETPLRDAPYGSAAATRRVGEGTAVLIQAARPGWYLVSFAGVRGWVLRGEVLRL